MTLVTINPQEYSYAFKLGPFDCYKVRTGVCSLNLTESEFQAVKLKEGSNAYRAGSVEYCRNFARHLIDTNILNENTGIHAYQYKCGHVSFGDGQHRTCIAKRLKLTNITLEALTNNEEYLCRPCYFSEEELKKLKTKKLLDLLFSTKSNKKVPNDFVADNYFYNE